MTQKGRARRRLIARLVPRGRHVIDVGADHGMVADSIGAIATERMPHRRGSAADRTGPAGLTWVIADGLAPFRTVDVAIIAGMGSKTIEGILTRGPTPTTLIAHAPDDPQRLRKWLASHGWRIDSERPAPEGHRLAESLDLHHLVGQ
ncbi:MAG: tRNA (adenine(22)-N(1))-methyltransferase TrmK, partial [Myxococcota bacterium]